MGFLVILHCPISESDDVFSQHRDLCPVQQASKVNFVQKISIVLTFSCCFSTRGDFDLFVATSSPFGVPTETRRMSVKYTTYTRQEPYGADPFHSHFGASVAKVRQATSAFQDPRRTSCWTTIVSAFISFASIIHAGKATCFASSACRW